MKKILLILIVLSLLLGGTIYVIYKNYYGSEEVEDIFKESESKEVKEDIKEKEDSKKVIVDIKGMVLNPGVYEVDDISRVNDVITMAGGLTDDADTSNINLAKIVNDEMTIIIYSKQEVIEKFKQEICICDCLYIENNACIENNSEEPEDGLININTANIEQLTTLPGVGDVKAEEIIKYRTDNGKFKDINELLNVDGIGEALFEKIKLYIKV